MEPQNVNPMKENILSMISYANIRCMIVSHIFRVRSMMGKVVATRHKCSGGALYIMFENHVRS